MKDIIAYVVSTFGIVYTVPGMRNWLHRHGFSYKKPAIVPGKANKERQAQWIEEYHKLKQELPVDETICFTDGVHPTHNIQPAYGWIRKGLRKELPANTGRARLNLSGAIDIRPLSKFMINLYSKLFLHRLGSKTSSNIDLILPEVCEFNRYKKNSNLGYQQFRKRSIEKINTSFNKSGS